MQTIDYSKLLAPAVARARALVPSDVVLNEDIYDDQGIHFWSKGRSRVWECVRLAEGALLIASQVPPGEVLNERQLVDQSDWIHIQFRVNGGGNEDVARMGVVQTPEGTCVVSRYPENCIVDRTLDATNGWKVACLFATPRAISHMLDVPASRFPEHAVWLAHEASAQPRSTVLALQSAMGLAVSDILSCTFRGCNRRTYMRGKSLELLSTVIHALGVTNSSTDKSELRLSELDLEKIAIAHSIMCAHLESTLTLRDLARKVGINRTKLALGFKTVYGVSVQAFWRNAKLDLARQLLRDGITPVTEVAFRIGYSELASFTRAFTRRFGIAPRACRVESKRSLNRD